MALGEEDIILKDQSIFNDKKKNYDKKSKHNSGNTSHRKTKSGKK